MDLIVNLEEIRSLALEHRDRFEVMRYLLEMNDEIDDGELDAIVERVAAPVAAAIDCTQCANCCRSLDVYLTQKDVILLGVETGISVDDLESRYVVKSAARIVGEWGKFAAKPCPFLRGKRCSVYPHRPETCRLYPAFTPDFRWVLADLIDGAGLCPIIYNVLNMMLEVSDRL